MANLIVNGDFSSGADDWTPIGTGNVNIITEAGDSYARSTTDTGGGGYAQSFTTVAEKTYTVNYDVFTNAIGSNPLQLTVDILDASGTIISSQVVDLPDGTAESKADALAQTFTFTTPAGTDGESTTIQFLETSASSINRGLNWDNVSITCFTRGTHIRTENGFTKIEDLRVGDMVVTSSHGVQPVRWIGSRKINAQEIEANRKLLPVRMVSGSLGKGLPERDLVVSQQHRMVISSKIAKRMFDNTDVLSSAIKLTAFPGIFVDEDVIEVEYFHVLFEDHEVIFAEGASTESLFTGPQAMKMISDAHREEILTLFPDLESEDHVHRTALQIPTGAEQRKLVARHVKNHKPLLELYHI